MLTGGPLGDEVRTGRAVGAAPAVAALCRDESSEAEGLRLGLEVELREARWPGVWVRGIGGMASVEMSREEVRAAVLVKAAASVGDEAEILWERMVFARRGDTRRSMGSTGPGDLGERAGCSAMVERAGNGGLGGMRWISGCVGGYLVEGGGWRLVEGGGWRVYWRVAGW